MSVNSRAHGETAGRSDIISFLPAVLSLASGDGGGNDATAFIKAHPDWRPEDQQDDEEKEEEQACSRNYCRCSKSAQVDAADGTAAISADPGVVQPPVPSAAATQPRKRATPIRGKAVETPPLPEAAATPIPALAGDPIGLAAEEDDFAPEPATTAKPAESVQAAAQEMGLGDEDETTPVEVAAEDAGDDDECPF